MSRPILVGYDPKTLDRAPVWFGAEMARFTRAPLVVASVEAGAPVLPISAREGLPYGVAQVDADLVADCGEAIGEIEAELRDAGVRVECVQVRGLTAARALHEQAEAREAGLLVAGSSRDGPLGRMLIGSTAERLLHGAPCPIAVIPRGWEPGGGLRTIGVAYVESDEGREALRGAHALARRAGATLRVITVVTRGAWTYAETEPTVGVRPPKGVEDVEGEHRVIAERALRAAVAGLAGDVPVEVDAFVDDEPADSLVQVSEHLDVLVCGSRAYGPLRSVLLGGVSRRVATEARCPVIVLPRGVGEALEALLEQAEGAPAAG